MINLFSITEKDICKKLSKQSYLRNGVGFGFISDDYLYDNCFLEIGLGRVFSGHGDWGGGFDKVAESAIKIVVDKNMVIQKVTTESFYNNRNSQRVERIAKRIAKRIKVGKKFKIKDPDFKKAVQGILDFLPCKAHIGWDVFAHPHMLDHYINPDNKTHYRNFRNPTNYAIT